MRRKMIIVLGTAVLVGTVAAGCGKSGAVETTAAAEETTAAAAETITIDTGEESADADSVWAALSGWNFVYSSGAGAWETDLTIASDGSFTGSYHDSDMGDSGKDYPNGTVYLSDFSGQFGALEKVDDYTYKTTIEKLKTEQPEGREELADDMKYVYTAPAGLTDAADIYLYLPGAPVSSLPEAYKEWVTFQLDDATELSFYGLFNERGEAGFYSWDSSDIEEGAITADDWSPELDAAADDTDAASDNADDLYTDSEKSTAKTDSTSAKGDSTAASSEDDGVVKGLVETLNQASSLEDRLEKGNLTQSEMNELSQELYTLWDTQLNTTWKQIKDKLDADAMEKLRVEERAWIKERDQKIKEAGEEYAGGSVQTMVMNMKGAELTKDRCYELFEYLR